MSSEMVEWVARAIVSRTAELTGQDPETAWAALGPKTHVFMIEMARAAIAAMREPTGEMVAGFVPQYGVYGDVEARAIWQKMIDAALSETVSTE